MRRMIALAAILCFTQTACFGSFAAVRSLHRFNKGVSGDKWVQEIVFFAMIVVPVYQLFSLGDALLFNSIEFWGGSNPIADGEDWEQERKVLLADGTEATLIREGADAMRIETADGTFRIERTAEGLRLLEGDRVVSEIREGSGGGVELLDAAGIRTISAAALQEPGVEPASVTAWAMAQGRLQHQALAQN